MLSVTRQVVNFKPVTFIRCFMSVKGLSVSNLPTRPQATCHQGDANVNRKRTQKILGFAQRLGSNEFKRCLSMSAARSVSRKDYVFPEVKEEEVEERFVRGSGPGGQSVNKTANCVVLKHLPTCIVVKCHETRSLETNRKRARERLLDRLDLHINGENSFLMTRQKEESDRRAEKKRRSRQRLEMKKAFKEAVEEN